MTATRLRQVALAARGLDEVGSALQRELHLSEPFRDPGVGEFGLQNVVFSAGDCFIEVVSPVRDGTAAGRYIQRRGGDAGYMAIFEVPDTAEARKRVADLGVRVVWQIDLDDIAGTHLHPQDVPGAIVSLDTPVPPGSWRWGGPAWAGTVPDHEPGGITGLTVAAVDPDLVAERWAAVLARAVEELDGVPAIALDRRRQLVTFEPAAEPAGEGIVGVTVERPHVELAHDVTVAGVRFQLVPVAPQTPTGDGP
jgi:hypothetical protein